MSTLVFSAEPNSIIEHVDLGPFEHLTPWRLPSRLCRFTPRYFLPFVKRRNIVKGEAMLGYPGVELGAKLWAGKKTNRLLSNRFYLRHFTGLWAARHSMVQRADTVVALSTSARTLFAVSGRSKKVLILDLPCLRQLHEDLDRAKDRHPSCLFLGRYRAPAWAIVKQEVEWKMADEIYVKGEFAKSVLLRCGVLEKKIKAINRSFTAITRQVSRSSELHVLLPGLAAARHGTCELLKVLSSRPWLRIHVKKGKGSEPSAFVDHFQVMETEKDTLSKIDAVLWPCHSESYAAEVGIAISSKIPVIATLRGSGNLSPSLFTLLQRCSALSIGKAVDELWKTRKR